jgi:hypothetical protein
MGGRGSGRKGWRVAVERCSALEANALGRRIDQGQVGGVIHWTRGGQSLLSVTFRVGAESNDRRRIVLVVRIESGGPDCPSESQTLRLRWEGTNINQPRWWFLCPRVGCHRKVARLYIPPRGGPFACRTCHGLTYQSRKDSGKVPFDAETAIARRLRELERLLGRRIGPLPRR